MMIAVWTILSLIGIGAGLYGLHRLALWLESKGLLFYRDKQATSTALGSFVALQRILEPETQHVITVNEQIDTEDEDGDDPHLEEPGE